MSEAAWAFVGGIAVGAGALFLIGVAGVYWLLRGVAAIDEAADL